MVKTGLLGRSNAADIGVPALPLGELHGDAAATLLAKLDAQVLIGTKVSAIDAAAQTPKTPPAHPSGPRFRLATAGAGTLPAEIAADAVVLAVPHEAAARLMPPGALPDGTVAGWAGLDASPIVNVHVIYDRPVTDLPFAAAVDSPVQWVFDRSRISGLDRSSPDRPQYLAISLSAADDYVDVPAARLRDRLVPALAELFPAARDARVIEFFVTRERRATFRQAPGSARLRPRPGTQLPGLVLAGAWTATGWPDTMEGAVRSGLAAAIELRRTVLSASWARTRPTTKTSTIGVSQ